MAVGSPLHTALGNIFMCSFENKWLKHCPYDLKHVFYRLCWWHICIIFVSWSLFVFIWKQCPQNFAFLNQVFSSYLPMKYVNFFKNRLMCNIILFPNVCIHTFHISHLHISQKLRSMYMWNLQHIIFIWRRRFWLIFKSALVYL